MPEENMVIEIPQDEVTTAAAAPADPPKEQAPEKVEKTETVTADAGVEDLKKQLDTITRQREAEAAQARETQARLAKEAREARQEAVKFRSEREQSNYETLVSGIEAATREADFAAKEFEDAINGGDAAKAAQAQRKIARAESKLTQLESAKSAIEEQIETRRNAKPDANELPEQQGDPFEKYIGQFSNRSQSWLRNHKEFVTDQKKNYKLVAAHNEAIAEDHVPDSDAYFDFIERKLKLKQDEVTADAPPEPTTRTRTAMPAAPVSHSAVNANGARASMKIELTPGEQQSATDGTIVWNYDDPKLGAKKGEPIGLKEMARRKSIMQKNNRYDVSFTNQ